MKIIIEEYQAEWIDKFLSEKERLGSTLVDVRPTIEHIGSTSVEGLCAKATIDILVGLQDETQLDQTIEPMITKGYTYFKKYEPPMPYRRLFSKLKPSSQNVRARQLGLKVSVEPDCVPSCLVLTPPEVVDVDDEFVRGDKFFPLYNIHIIVKDTRHWHRQIAFRDYLRAHPDVRDDYDRLKKELSRFEYKDTNDYNQAKDNFIKKVEIDALAWYNLKHQ